MSMICKNIILVSCGATLADAGRFGKNSLRAVDDVSEHVMLQSNVHVTSRVGMGLSGLFEKNGNSKNISDESL